MFNKRKARIGKYNKEITNINQLQYYYLKKMRIYMEKTKKYKKKCKRMKEREILNSKKETVNNDKYIKKVTELEKEIFILKQNAIYEMKNKRVEEKGGDERGEEESVNKWYQQNLL
ncbi:hypothetical protein NUSPORA_01244 [Nucleospora cyclopteri]